MVVLLSLQLPSSSNTLRAIFWRGKSTVTLSDIWLRMEHQALVAMPRSGGILFGIRVVNHSLAEVKRDRAVAEKLVRALRTMPEAMAAYKGLATSCSRIAALLDDSS